jgi:hypothetical protein
MRRPGRGVSLHHSKDVALLEVSQPSTPGIGIFGRTHKPTAALDDTDRVVEIFDFHRVDTRLRRVSACHQPAVDFWLAVSRRNISILHWPAPSLQLPPEILLAEGYRALRLFCKNFQNELVDSLRSLSDSGILGPLRTIARAVELSVAGETYCLTQISHWHTRRR